MPRKTLEQRITERFLEVVADSTGRGHKWRFKNGFAHDLEMFPQELRRIETGRTPQLRNLVRLQELTGVKWDWLMTGKGSKY